MAYTTTPADNEAIANLPGDIRAVTALVTGHTEATSAAHEAGAISYGTTTVGEALDTAAGHESNQNNPHGVTAAQAGAVALTDAVVTVTAGKVVKRDANGKIAGDITGNAATATKLQTARTISLTGAVTGSTTFDGSGNASISTVADGGTAWANPRSFTASRQQYTSGANDYHIIWESTKTTTNTNAPGTPDAFPLTPEGITTDSAFATTGVSGSQKSKSNYRRLYSYIDEGIPAGTYSLASIIQELVNRSHRHKTHGTQGSYITNCDCNCNTDN